MREAHQVDEEKAFARMTLQDIEFVGKKDIGKGSYGEV